MEVEEVGGCSVLGRMPLDHQADRLPIMLGHPLPTLLSENRGEFPMPSFVVTVFVRREEVCSTSSTCTPWDYVVEA